MEVRLDQYGQKALELVMEGRSFFLTGKAGDCRLLQAQ